MREKVCMNYLVHIKMRAEFYMRAHFLLQKMFLASPETFCFQRDLTLENRKKVFPWVLLEMPINDRDGS
jgi:hypothetical protein